MSHKQGVWLYHTECSRWAVDYSRQTIQKFWTDDKGDEHHDSKREFITAREEPPSLKQDHRLVVELPGQRVITTSVIKHIYRPPMF